MGEIILQALWGVPDDKIYSIVFTTKPLYILEEFREPDKINCEQNT